MSNSFIWPIDGTLSGASTPGLSEYGSIGKEGVYHISPIFWTGPSSSNGLVSYLGYMLAAGLGSYSSAEMQLLYSIASAARAEMEFNRFEFRGFLLLDWLQYQG